jgi:protein-disulfide isomerase
VKFTSMLTAGAVFLAMGSSAVIADDVSMSVDQKQAIEKIVHDYLVSNPEVLLEASQALQQKQQQTMQKQAQSAILENATQLLSDQYTVSGNPKGQVTLVEFFDYQCVHCKKMAAVINNLVKNNSNLRVIYKEFPIFGKSSDMASKAALAAAIQNKYLLMHQALLAQEKPLNDKIIEQIAKSIGLNMKAFKTDITSKAVNEALEANRKLAEQLHLAGTPAFIIASTPKGTLKADTKPDFIPGAASSDTLQELIKKASE